MQRKPADLEGPVEPEALMYLWSWFNEVFHGAALTYGEIESWSRLTAKNVTAFEVNIIRGLVSRFIGAQNGDGRRSKSTD